MYYIESNINYNLLRPNNYEIIDDEILRLYKQVENNDNQYVIGMPFVSDNMILVGINIDPNLFKKNKYDEVLDYCMEMNYVKPNWERLEIMQIKHINTEWKYYTCIIKTYYLKLIQRIWKKKLMERKKKLESNLMIKILREREYGKKYKI